MTSGTIGTWYINIIEAINMVENCWTQNLFDNLLKCCLLLQCNLFAQHIKKTNSLIFLFPDLLLQVPGEVCSQSKRKIINNKKNLLLPNKINWKPIRIIISYCWKKFKETRHISKGNFWCSLFSSLSTIILFDNDVNKVHQKFPLDMCLICLKFFQQ